MEQSNLHRRRFLKDAVTTAAGISLLSAFPEKTFASEKFREISADEAVPRQWDEPRIKFSVIGINHAHIYSQVDAVIRGGGQLVSVYAKEPDLIASFTKKYPQVKLARSENEILE